MQSMPKRRLRLVRLVPELDFGGVESRLILYAKMHDRSEIDLRVCGFSKHGDTAQQLEALGVPVDVLHVSPRPRPQTTLALAAYLRRHRPDVLHCSIAEANIHGLAAGWLSRVPVRIAEEVGMPVHGPRARLVFRGLYATASAVVGVSENICEYVRTVDKAPPARVRRIYNAARPRFFPLKRPNAERPPKAWQRLVMVGRLHEVKNHATVIRAMALVRETVPELSLTIVGEGPLRAELVALRDELELQASVEFVGFRPDVDVLLRECGGFVLASHSEGCSISLIEAMASANVVLGSTAAGIQEIMGPLASGWTAPATDIEAWAELLRRFSRLTASERPVIAHRLQDRAYQEFSPESYVNNLARLYRELHVKAA